MMERPNLDGSGLRGLPIPELPSVPGPSGIFFVTTKMDDRGRLADRSALRELAWQPGSPVSFTIVGAVIVAAPHRGRFMITQQGHVRIPAPVRHRCRIRPGDPLMLLVPSARDRLAIYTASALEAALLGGDPYSATIE